MVICFKHIATHLGTRAEGATVRNRFIPLIRSGEKVVFDFDGVETVSNSFADECFAKLVLDFDITTIKTFTTFINTSTFINSVITNSFKERISRSLQPM